jgi:peptide/nickel transport system permease protein
VHRFSFVGRRLVQLIPVAVGVTIITFFLIHLIPGDPASAILGNHYTPAAAKALRASLGLDKPLWQQYFVFMGNLVHGNLGTSTYYQEPVLQLISERLAPTVWLVVMASLIALAIAIPVAVLAALHRDGPIDQAVRGLFTVTLAMPAFWVGIVLALVFGVYLHWLPVSGFGDNFGDHVYHLILPALTVALSFTGVLVRSLRNSILSVMQTDYVETARAKGLTGRRIMLAHILRNALLSTVTIFGVNIAFLMGGTVIVETVFALGGVGQLLTSAISQRDYEVVQGITLVIAAFVVAINILTDIVYALLDPRVSVN